MTFTWIPFYKEFAQKLVQFRSNRKLLVDWIYANLDSSYIKHLKDAPDGRRVPDVDPFTVMAIFNRGITDDKRIDICTRFKEYLRITAPAPQDFNGIPVMNTQRSNFMGFEADRENEDIDRLWNVFEDAVLDKDIKASYNALSHQYLIKFNITIGLFWIRPDKYLPLDGNSQTLLNSLDVSFDKSKFLPYEEYVKVMQTLTDRMVSESLGFSDYAEFSAVAYQQKQNKNKTVKPHVDSSIRYWTYSPGPNASKWELCIHEGIMCVGWDDLGDLSQYASREKMRDAVKLLYPTDGSAVNDSLAVWQFANEMKSGDIVFAKKGKHEIIGRGIVESDYVFDTNRMNYKHLRKVKWTDLGEWITDDRFAVKTLTDISPYPDFVKNLNKLIDEPSEVISESKVKDGTSDVDYWWLYANPKYWEVDTFSVGEIQEYTAYNDQGNKRQKFKYFKAVKPGDKLVCYETYPTRRVKALCEITQGLHEDDGYEIINFVIQEKVAYEVSWRELILNDVFKGSEPYRAATGSLYHLTKEEYDVIVKLANGEKRDTYSKKDFLNEVFVSADDYDKLENLLLRKKNLILKGAPGVGKTFAATKLAYAIMGEKDEARVMQVQFHQNYSYEDFVMGFKPNEEGGFELRNGKFYDFCKTAENDRERKYFAIIDEINRGNLSKIFGELLMLIENDYRDKPIQLAYKDEMFAVPSNLYIIGMMNTADRSLAMIDYALRRRFSFFEMKPAFENPIFQKEVTEKNDSRLDNLVQAIVKLNEVIENDDSLGSGFCIGHSYLCNLGTDYNLENIVEYDIIPMLREYWFDNDERFNQEAQKLRNVL